MLTFVTQLCGCIFFLPECTNTFEDIVVNIGEFCQLSASCTAVNDIGAKVNDPANKSKFIYVIACNIWDSVYKNMSITC